MPQTFPETLTEDRILPPNSVLGFQSADGNPVLFTLDATTNKIAVFPIDPWLFTSIIMSVAASVVAPLVASMVAFFLIIRGARKCLEAYRLERLSDEQNLNQVTQEFDKMRREENPRKIAEAREMVFLE